MVNRKWPEPGCCGPMLSVMSRSSSDSFTIWSPSLFDSSNLSSRLVILSTLYPKVLPERRDVCPVLWQQEPLVSWMSIKVNAQHFKCLPLVVFDTLVDVN